MLNLTRRTTAPATDAVALVYDDRKRSRLKVTLASGRVLALSPRHFIPVATDAAATWDGRVVKAAEEVGIVYKDKFSIKGDEAARRRVMEEKNQDLAEGFLGKLDAMLNTTSLVVGRKAVAGSFIGGLPETQEMLDFCGARGVTSDVEIIRMQDINAAYARMLRSDVKYRFVIDMASLRNA